MNNSLLLENTDDIISNYLLDKFKLWVWDFDDTLIDTATYYKKSMEPPDIINRTDKELTIDVPNWKYFKNIVIFLISRGKRVGIASFGTFKIIKAYMDRIFGLNQKIFTAANLKALCRGSDGRPLKFYPNKNDFIDSMMQNYRIYEPLQVVLFDDNMTNIAYAMDSGIVGVKIIGKDNDSLQNKEYCKHTDIIFFGKNIIIQLENTLKRCESTEQMKNGFPSNNLKNETFSAIGSRKIGVLNKAKRLEREKFYESIKNKKNEEDGVDEVDHGVDDGDGVEEFADKIPYKKPHEKPHKKPHKKPTMKPYKKPYKESYDTTKLFENKKKNYIRKYCNCFNYFNKYNKFIKDS
jgi:hypothetical protein